MQIREDPKNKNIYYFDNIYKKLLKTFYKRNCLTEKLILWIHKINTQKIFFTNKKNKKTAIM